MEKIIKKSIRLGELEEWLDSFYEYEEDMDFEILSHDSFDPEQVRFYVENLAVRIPAFNLTMRSGACQMWDEEDGNFYDDWSATLIKEGDGYNLGNDFYFEQDGFVVSLNNYLHGIEGTYSLDIECEVVLLDLDMTSKVE